MPARTPSASPDRPLAAPPTGATRRSMLLTTAWAVPTVALTVGTPAFAGSVDTVSARMTDPQVQRGGSTTLTVTILTGAGVAKQGRSVGLSISGSGVTATPASGVTDAQGVFRSTIQVAADAASGTATVAVATPDGSTAATLAVAGSLMLVTDGSVFAPGSTSVVRARLVDAQGSPVEKQTVSFEGERAIVISPSNLVTGSDGWASSTMTIPSDTPGGAYTIAVSNDTYGTAEAHISVVETLRLELSPASVEQGGSSRATVTARDDRGDLASGVEVRLSVATDADGAPIPGISVSPSVVQTGANGAAVATISVDTSAPVGRTRITATTSRRTSSADLSVLTPVVALTASLGSAVVAWGQSTPVTIVATNSDRSPAARQDISVSVSGSGVTLSAAGGTTDGDGRLVVQAAVSSSPSSSGERVITATWGSHTAQTTLTIDAVRARITGFTRPHAIGIANTTAYVVDRERLVVASTQTNAVQRSATLPVAASEIVMAGGKFAYLNTGDGRVLVYEPTTNNVTATISRPGGGRGAGQIAVQQSKWRVYACLPYDDVVMVANTQNNTYLTSISLPRVGGVAVGQSSLNMFVYALDGDGMLHVIQASNNTVLDSLDLEVGGTGRITVSSDGERGYIAAGDGETDWFVVVNLRTVEIVGKTQIASGSSGIALAPNGARVYVSSLTGIVTGFSTADNTRVSTYPAGPAASGLAIASNNTTAYVTNYDTGSPGVSVVDVR